jgi:hypothetical protein
VYAKATKPFSRDEKGTAIELATPQIQILSKRAQGDPCTNIKEQKSKIEKLLVTRMSDSNYLKKLVESMPRKLIELINKEKKTTTTYYYASKINIFLYIDGVFLLFNCFLH